LNLVTPSIAQSIVYTDLASKAWNDCRERFSRVDHVRVSDLQRNMYNLKQNHIFVSEYFTEMSTIKKKLELYRPVPQCICVVT